MVELGGLGKGGLSLGFLVVVQIGPAQRVGGVLVELIAISRGAHQGEDGLLWVSILQSAGADDVAEPGQFVPGVHGGPSGFETVSYTHLRAHETR